ncbi:MAG: recombination regulator RecX [Oscillospiraceae bacterium]|nr:recombination regulator RecX [Oscillospiraceae bacterium]
MRIASVQPGRKKGRHFVNLEDGRSLTVSEAVLAQFYLYPGKELEEGEIQEIQVASDLQAVKAKAYRLLDRRAMSRNELIRKLVEKEVEESDAEETADFMEEIGLINDEHYAVTVVECYGAKGYGRRRVEQELWRRGVEKDLWEQALQGLPEGDDKLDRFIQSKLQGEVPDPKEKKRVADGLIRRGFSWDEISAGFARYMESIEEE